MEKALLITGVIALLALIVAIFGRLPKLPTSGTIRVWHVGLLVVSALVFLGTLLPPCNQETVQEPKPPYQPHVAIGAGAISDVLQAEKRFADDPPSSCTYIGFDDGVIRCVVPGGDRFRVVRVIRLDENGCSLVPLPDGRAFRYERVSAGNWKRCE